MQRVGSGSLSKRSGTPRRPLTTPSPVWILAGVMAPAAVLLTGCGSGADLMSIVVLPTQQTEGFVDGVGVPPTTNGNTGSGRLDLTDMQQGYLDALIAVGIIVAATTLGGSLSGLFNKISTKLDVTVP